MSGDLYNWAEIILFKLYASKSIQKIDCLPDEPTSCARAIREVIRKYKWNMEVRHSQSAVFVKVISKAKPASKRKQKLNKIKDAVREIMIDMKPLESRRFVCDKYDFQAARNAVYSVRNELGVRFRTSKSKDGVLVIIRR